MPNEAPKITIRGNSRISSGRHFLNAPADAVPSVDVQDAMIEAALDAFHVRGSEPIEASLQLPSPIPPAIFAKFADLLKKEGNADLRISIEASAKKSGLRDFLLAQGVPMATFVATVWPLLFR